MADPACFVWAIVRSSRTALETLYVVLPPPTHEPREDELERMWRNAQRSIAEIEREDGAVSVSLEALTGEIIR